MSTYQELLKSPLWQKKRLEIMQRDNFTCQHCCSQDKELHIHHHVYKRNAKVWEYEDSELITLCSKCHENETNYNSECYEVFMEAKNLFKSRGLSMSLFTAILQNICWRMYEDYENDGSFDHIDSIIANAAYGTQNMSDAIKLTNMSIDCTELINYLKIK